LRKTFLAGRFLKKDELPNTGENVERFQIRPQELPSQNPDPFYKGEMKVDHDQASPGQFAASAVNGDFFICQVFVANFNIQLESKVFQMLKQ
jgi:hypothetical protein